MLLRSVEEKGKTVVGSFSFMRHFLEPQARQVAFTVQHSHSDKKRTLLAKLTELQLENEAHLTSEREVAGDFTSGDIDGSPSFRLSWSPVECQ